MKILTKKKQKRLMFDLIDIFLMGSDALKAVGTRQPMDPAQALQRQMKMIDAAMDAANIIRGFYGNQLLMEADPDKYQGKTAATEDMLTADMLSWRIGATIGQKFSRQFALQKQAQKVDYNAAQTPADPNTNTNSGEGGNTGGDDDDNLEG